MRIRVPFAARILGQDEAVSDAINSRKILGIRLSNFVCTDAIRKAVLAELMSANGQ